MDGGCGRAEALAGYALYGSWAGGGAASGGVHRSLDGDDGARSCGGGVFPGAEGCGERIGAGVQELGQWGKRVDGADVSAVDGGGQEEHPSGQLVLRAGWVDDPGVD